MSPFGLVVIFIVGILVLAIFIMIKYGSKFQKAFKGVPIEDIIASKCSTILNVTRDVGDWGNITKAETTIGKILSVGHLTYMCRNPMSKREWAATYKKDKKDYPYSVESSLYLMKVSYNLRIPVIRNILDLLGGVKYSVISKEDFKRIIIEKHGKAKTYFIINPEANVVSFANIYVYGFYALHFAQSLGWVYGREKELESLVNYPKRVVFLETTHAKKIDTFEELNKLEQKKYEKRLDSLSSK